LILKGRLFAMKKKRFSIEQTVAVLKQAELGMPVADLIQQFGVSEQTIYRWNKQYAGASGLGAGAQATAERERPTQEAGGQVFRGQGRSALTD
jgi:transposase-like protein